MIKIIFIFVFVSLYAKIDVNISSDHVILMNAKTKRVLYEKGARQKVYPASTTKIATTLWALQKSRGMDLSLQMCSSSFNALKNMHEGVKRARNFQIPPYRLEPDGSSIYLKIGEKLSMKTLLYGMLLSSGNDAANVIAESFDGDIDLFMLQLNAFLRKLGIHNTNFLNPHGLHHPDHYTTAYDMALIATHCLEESFFRQIIKCREYIRPRSNVSPQSIFVQGNQLLKKSSRFYYDKAYGIKTGRTRIAGFNLVAAAKHNDRDLIVVVHKAKDSQSRYKDAIDLFNAAFDEKKASRKLFVKNETQFAHKIKGAKRDLLAIPSSDIILHYYPSEVEEVTAKVEFIDLKLPIKKGQKVGYLKVYDHEGLYLSKNDLYAKENVAMSFFAKTCFLLTSWTFYLYLSLVALFIYIFMRYILPKIQH